VSAPGDGGDGDSRLGRLCRAGRAHPTAVKITAALMWGALVAAAAVHLPKLSFDNDTWLPAANPLRAELESFRAEFEPHEALLVAVELPVDFFAPEMTRAVRELEAALAALPAVRHVLSPVSATTIIKRGDALEITAFGDALDKGLLDAESYRARFDLSPYAGKLLSPAHRVVALRVGVDRAGAEARARAVAAIEATVRRHVAAIDAVAHLAGEAALKDELNRATRAQLPRLLALAALALAVFLRLACGGWRRAALVFTAAGAAVAAGLGLTAALGLPVNAVLLALPVMLAVIAVADALHILARWDGLGGDGGPSRHPRSLLSGGGGGDGHGHGDGDSDGDTGDARHSHSDSDGATTARLTVTIGQTWLPCLAASVTSAVGFGAFALSELVPLRHFGWASAAAILYAYPLIVGALWGGLWLLPGLRRAPVGRFPWGRLVAAVYQLSTARAGRITLAALVVAALLGGGLIHLRTETNFLSVFFAEDSRVRRAFDLVDARLGGSGRVEVVLRGDAGDFATVDALAQVRRIAGRAVAIGTVNHVDSYLLPVALTHEAFVGDIPPRHPRSLLSGGDGESGDGEGDGEGDHGESGDGEVDGDGDGHGEGDHGESGDGEVATTATLPTTDAALAQELLFLSLSRSASRRDVLSPYLNFDHSGARLSLQTANLDSPQLRRTIAAATTAAGDFTVTDTATNTATNTVTDIGTVTNATTVTDIGTVTNPTVTITGFGVFIHHLGRLVLRTQAFSLALTLTVIGALLLVQFGWRAGLCGFTVNLLPLIATAGLVAWLGHPFDFAAILIAGVTLGLSVDDTIHFLHHYRRGGDKNIARALHRTARPIVITSALFCCGLAVVGASDLVVLRKFAAFTTFGITAALLATLVVLPALLRLSEK